MLNEQKVEKMEWRPGLDEGSGVWGKVGIGYVSVKQKRKDPNAPQY